MFLFHQYSCPKGVILRPHRARQCCTFMCVLNVLKLTNEKLHSLHLYGFCFMWLALSIQLTNKRLILCLCKARQRCFSMWVLNDLNFTNVKLHSLYLNSFSSSCGWLYWYSWPKKSYFVSMQGKTMLFLHVCIKQGQFYKCKIAFIVSKSFFFMWLAPPIQLTKKE